MIDCHAHAFPEAQRWAAKVPAGLRVDSVLQGAERLVLPLSDQLRAHGPKLAWGIEGLAALRRQLPPVMGQLTEFFLSLGLGPPMVLTANVAQLAASMARHGIQRTVIIAAPPTAPNDWLLEATAADPRFVPVVCLLGLPADRRRDTPHAWAAAWAALADQGAAGFKIHPNLSGLAAEHPAHHGAFQAARATGSFVILHTGHFTVPGYRNLRPADPRHFEPLFAAYPDVKVCLAHMNRDHPEVVWDLMARHSQVWTDTSWQPAHVIARALQTIGPERLLLGSDWPLLHPDLQGDALAVLRQAASEADVSRITCENAETFLSRRR